MCESLQNPMEANADTDALPVHFGCQAYSLLTFSAIFGLSAMSAIAADLLSVWTGQLFVCHWVLRRIFVWQRSTLHSLWNLFRGADLSPYCTD